jgi:hypothetical protein
VHLRAFLPISHPLIIAPRVSERQKGRSANRQLGSLEGG